MSTATGGLSTGHWWDEKKERRRRRKAYEYTEATGWGKAKRINGSKDVLRANILLMKWWRRLPGIASTIIGVTCGPFPLALPFLPHHLKPLRVQLFDAKVPTDRVKKGREKDCMALQVYRTSEQSSRVGRKLTMMQKEKEIGAPFDTKVRVYRPVNDWWKAVEGTAVAASCVGWTASSAKALAPT